DASGSGQRRPADLPQVVTTTTCWMGLLSGWPTLDIVWSEERVEPDGTQPGPPLTVTTPYRLRALVKKGNLIARNQALSVVLVDGGFVDGTGWEGVYSILKRDGYDVSIVQNPTVSLAHDVAATHLIIAAQDRPVVLVGHSYGGAVITEAGNDPK